jgi:outer membrane protein assembly factor BamB
VGNVGPIHFADQGVIQMTVQPTIRGILAFSILAAAFQALAGQAVIAQQDQLLVLDGDRVVKYQYPSGQPTNHFIGAGLTAMSDSYFMYPANDGNIYISDSGTNAVYRFNGQTGVPDIDPFVKPGAGGLSGAGGLEFGPDGKLYVASFGTDSILQYNQVNGAFIKAFITPGSGTLDGAGDIQFDDQGNLWVTSIINDKLLKYNGSTGAFLAQFVAPAGTSMDFPRQLLIDGDGTLMIGCDLSQNIFRLPKGSNALGQLVNTNFRIGGMTISPEGWLLAGPLDSPNVYQYDRTTGQFLGQAVFANNAGGLTGARDFMFLPAVDTCYADCDGNGALNIDDFICFQTFFVLGC